MRKSKRNKVLKNAILLFVTLAMLVSLFAIFSLATAEKDVTSGDLNIKVAKTAKGPKMTSLIANIWRKGTVNGC
jgi:hypothetical protein